MSHQYLERANAETIVKILESLLYLAVSLDKKQIRGQAFDGASVMSPRMAGVHARIKEIPMASFTRYYSHCLNLSIAASCQVQEVRNMIGLINESYLMVFAS